MKILALVEERGLSMGDHRRSVANVESDPQRPALFILPRPTDYSTPNRPETATGAGFV